jgi:uncharacterized protein YndB with AHSA1/START domain
VTTLTSRLDRTILIRASAETVFAFFTDNERWATWWGAGSTIDPRPGGAIAIRYPNGAEALGAVIEIVPPERLVFSFGFPAGKPVSTDGSRVTIRLSAVPRGTELTLTHEFADAAVRDEFVQGWRHQLALFANAVMDRQHAGAPAIIDGWFAAWAEVGAAARRRAFERVVSPDVVFRDRYSLVAGLDDLSAHVGAVHRFMPGVAVARAGDPRHCQGQALADWTARSDDGQPRGGGTNLFEFDATGRIASVTGFWR